MADTIYLETYQGTIYLSGTTVAQWTGSGTPWDTLATSPFRIAGNSEVDDFWTPTIAPTTAIYTGERLAGTSRQRVTETIGINIYANTPDRAVALVQLLRQRANWASYVQPALLSVKPNTSTDAVYYEVYKADIQETNHFVRSEYKYGHIRVHMIIERSAVGGLYRAGSSLIAATSVGPGIGAGTTNLVNMPTSVNGDIEEEGAPLNITLSSLSATTMTKLWLGLTVAATTDTTSAGTYATSNTTTGLIMSAGTSTTSMLLDTLNGDRNLRPRIMARFSAMASNAEVRMGVSFGDTTTPMFYTPWIDPPDVATIVDFGTFPIDRFVSLDLVSSAVIFFYVRSTNGSSASVTLVRTANFLYRQFCAIDTAFTASVNNFVVRTFNTATSNSRAALPRTPMAARRSSGNSIIGIDAIRGDVPRGYAYDDFKLHQLYMSWLGAGGLWTSGETCNVTVEYAPLYRSFRGNS